MNDNSDHRKVFGSGGGGTGARLQGLIERAELHSRAEQLVMSAIPDGLAPGTRFVSYREGELVLSTDNAGKATQLRFRQHEIMAALRQHEPFQYAWKVRIKVSPPRFRHTRKPEKAPLSNENARLLKEEAGHTKDKALREVLEKLASHVRD
ncbi:DUF721 domain-containing protein [Marinobacter oulmenensis]|uniref:DUF721 domain-containing protein n=1 Tax=Marinobacter oulmenensis TaxID=643747 RepID=A0A840UC25_9GAMM|nr:DUF721 domain-containing protein [Marinobacter oulmenensis]MBB5322669.1 hypothetical protein [Marinobacter oulmenensis]